jgi:hypothetical protein
MQETIEPCLIAHRQNNLEAQGPGCWQMTDGLRVSTDNHVTHMTRQ